MPGTKIKSDGRTITVRVPISIRKRSGRKIVLTPSGQPDTGTMTTSRKRVDGAVIKAIARAIRWQSMIEDGTYMTIAEIAAAEKINESYVSRILRLALLAPEVVEHISKGSQPDGLTLESLLTPISEIWSEQAAALGLVRAKARKAVNIPKHTE